MGYKGKYPMGYMKAIRRVKMTHAIQGKQKLLNRVRRLEGQIGAVSRALEKDVGCTEVMHLLTAVRGAVNGIMAELVEDHIHMHMIETRKPSRSETQAASELIDVLRTYIR
jgi:DNA-binding FrmR family transcriptional regulator